MSHLSKKIVQNIVAFEEKQSAPHQANILIKLYRIALNMNILQWDKIKSVNGYPKINRRLSEDILEAFIAFDSKYHKSTMKGGLWFNTGFSTLDTENIPYGTIDINDVEVIYQ